MLWLFAAISLADPVASSGGTHWVSTGAPLRVTRRPDPASAVRGEILRGEPFAVIATGTGPGCRSWGQVADDGWACLDRATPTTEAPAPLPRPLAYEPPFPEDYFRYTEERVWQRRNTAEDDLLPFIYARRMGEWKGRVYRDVAAWERGDAPITTVPVGRRARFVSAAETSRGRVLVRSDGTVVPEDDVYVFPITRFQGRDLRERPIPEGKRLAWAIDYENTAVFPSTRGLDAEGVAVGGPLTRIPYHEEILVESEPVDGKWWRIANFFGPYVDGFVQDGIGVQVFVPTDRPADVDDGERWVDVDRERRVLSMWEGDTPIYATLVSTGLSHTGTPRGIYRIYDKSAWADMASAPGAADYYHVEAVPWVMHFKPRYALHGAYWHWGMGHQASHGCVNLAPKDARWVYENVTPTIPDGWHTVHATDREPGTVLRIR